MGLLQEIFLMIYHIMVIPMGYAATTGVTFYWNLDKTFNINGAYYAWFD